MGRRAGAGFIILAMLLGALALTGCQKQEAAATAPEALPVRVATVALEPADDTVRYPAVIKPRVEADIGFRVAGKVIARLVEVGARVEPGTPLARLDPTDLDLQVRSSQAQLASAKADAANARADFERYAKLRQGEWTTQQEYDRRKTTLDKAVAAVREAEAQLRVLDNSAQYSTLVADAPGVITATQVEPGQVVAQGQTAFKIARLGAMDAVADIPEQRVAGLSDRRLSVELWARPGSRIRGTLREMAPSADPATRTYQAKIALIDPPPDVQLGMTATLVSEAEHDRTIARLPLTAVTQDGTKPAVWVVSEAGETGGKTGDGLENNRQDTDRLELRPVTVAAYAGDFAIVSAGLKDGEKVVTAGVHKLDAGQRVRIWTEPAR